MPISGICFHSLVLWLASPLVNRSRPIYVALARSLKTRLARRQHKVENFFAFTIARSLFSVGLANEVHSPHQPAFTDRLDYLYGISAEANVFGIRDLESVNRSAFCIVVLYPAPSYYCVFMSLQRNWYCTLILSEDSSISLSIRK